MRFATITRQFGNQVVVEVRGAVDMSTGPRLRQRLLEAVYIGGPRLVVDLGAVEFIDSTGLGVLVSIWKRVGAHEGSLRIVATSDAVMQPLRITGLHNVFDLRPSVEAALASERGDYDRSTSPAQRARSAVSA